jgi:hypothetical protein
VLDNNVVVSSFVKLLRVEAVSSTAKAERLLEHMAAAEAADQPHWDSDVLIG